jgi:DNA-binding NarL/FixJ family response regulator
VVQEALGLGAFAYVVKSDAGSELLTAVCDVLRGEKFVGLRFAGHDSTLSSDAQASESVRQNRATRTLSSIRFKRTSAGG